jgi:hypothetical protein
MIASTLVPVIVSRSASAAGLNPGRQYSLSQSIGTRI